MSDGGDDQTRVCYRWDTSLEHLGRSDSLPRWNEAVWELFDAVRELRNHSRRRTLKGRVVFDFGGTHRMDRVVEAHGAMMRIVGMQRPDAESG